VHQAGLRGQGER